MITSPATLVPDAEWQDLYDPSDPFTSLGARFNLIYKARIVGWVTRTTLAPSPMAILSELYTAHFPLDPVHKDLGPFMYVFDAQQALESALLWWNRRN